MEEEKIEGKQEGDKAVAAEDIGGRQMANKGKAAAAEEIGGRQMVGKDTERIDETSK